jgi:predicted permease
VKRGGQTSIPWVDFKDWRNQTRAFAGLGGWTGGNMNIADDRGMPEQARGTYMTANAFTVVGQRPLLGRDFGPEDEKRGADRAVILGYTIWRNRYGGDPNVVGKLTRINGEPAVIVGVMPEGMMFPQNSEIWAAFIPNEQQERRTWRGLAAFGRVQHGTTRAAALAELDTLASRVKTEYPKDYEELGGMILETFNQRFNGGPIRAIFLSMMGAVVFVLLIACANVANLLLSRSASRAREVAVRLALGATRWRVVRQLLFESVLLGAIGGVLGLAIAVFGVRAFDAAVADSGKPYWIQFTIDYVVVGFLAGICLLTGILFGLAPALHVSRTNVHGVLKEGGRGNAGGGRVRWLTSTMVVVEVALTLVLLVGAGLMVRSFLNLYRVDIGMRTDRLLAMNLQLAGDKYQKPEARRAFYERLEPRLATIPGAEHVALTTSVPAFGVGRRPLEVDGRPAPKIEDAPTVGAVTISPGFFDVAGVSVVRGRGFAEADGSPGAENVVINEQLAAEHFKNEDPIGKRIRFMQSAPQPGQPPPTPAVWRTIVGIVPNVRHTNIQDADSVAAAYLPWRQETPGFATVIMRSSVAPDTLMAAVRKEVQTIDPDQPVFNLRTMERMMQNLMWPYRVFGSLFTIFAFIGLMLSAVGLYAVMAYAVTQRTQEIGVRMALGAQGNQVTWMVLKRGLFQLGLGLAIGLAGGYFAGQALPSRILVRTTATDPWVFIAITLVLSIVAITACLVPARRAMRVDPLVALRAE